LGITQRSGAMRALWEIVMVGEARGASGCRRMFVGEARAGGARARAVGAAAGTAGQAARGACRVGIDGVQAGIALGAAEARVTIAC